MIRFLTIACLSWMPSATDLIDACGSTFAAEDSEDLDCRVDSTNKKTHPMPLYLVSDKLKETMGARCLDGSAPGFYFQAAPAKSQTPNSWVLYFKGGGWCYDEKSCAMRAKGQLGGNAHFPKTFAFSGPMDSDPSINPEFAGFNRVVLWYCDGASFSGMRREPYHYKP